MVIGRDHAHVVPTAGGVEARERASGPGGAPGEADERVERRDIARAPSGRAVELRDRRGGAGRVERSDHADDVRVRAYARRWPRTSPGRTAGAGDRVVARLVGDAETARAEPVLAEHEVIACAICGVRTAEPPCSVRSDTTSRSALRRRASWLVDDAGSGLIAGDIRRSRRSAPRRGDPDLPLVGDDRTGDAAELDDAGDRCRAGSTRGRPRERVDDPDARRRRPRRRSRPAPSSTEPSVAPAPARPATACRRRRGDPRGVGADRDRGHRRRGIRVARSGRARSSVEARDLPSMPSTQTPAPPAATASRGPRACSR